jgi:hypothetical protein
MMRSIDARFGTAKWIWPAPIDQKLFNKFAQLRRVVNFKSVPKKAVIHVSADQQYRLFVNGAHIHMGPARGFQTNQPYDTIDIAPFLRKGENVISAVAHTIGTGHFHYINQNCAGFLLSGKIGGEDISSSGDWQSRIAPGYLKTITRVVDPHLGYQEYFDARLGSDDWMKPGLPAGDGWVKPYARPFGVMPWHSMEERGIPLLKFENVLPKKIVSEAAGKCGQGYAASDDVVTLYFNEQVKWRKARQSLKPGKDYAGFEIPAAGDNGYSAVCIDAGREVMGSIALKVEGADGGEIVDTIISEAMEGTAPVIREPSKLACWIAFGNRLILREGTTEHAQFDHWGFRYIVVIVRNSRKPLSIGIRVNWMGYPLEVKSEFESSDAELNRIYEVCAWSQQCCMLDAYMDCPWREQAQWWGDARVQGMNTFYLSADARLFARGIRQIGQMDVPNGLTYGLAPTIAHTCILPDYTLTWIISFHDYWWQTGDVELFRTMKERVRLAFEYFFGMTEKNGLLASDDRYWMFLDWSDICKDGYPTLYNMQYLMALRYAAEMSGLIGDRATKKLYEAKAASLQKTIETKLFDRKTRTFHGGLDWKNKPAMKGSSHLYALAILLDMLPEHHAEFVEKQLVPVSKGGLEQPMMPTAFFSYYILEAMKKAGATAEAADCVKRWWTELLAGEKSTTQEHWKTRPGEGSMCHAWSAHPVVHLSNILLGIWQTSAGWDTIRFEPTFTMVNDVHGKVATPHGVIETGWKTLSKGHEVFVKLPKGMKAKVALPGVAGTIVTGSGKWLVK